MTVYEIFEQSTRVKVKRFGYRNAFTLILLAVWGPLLWLGEVILHFGF